MNRQVLVRCARIALAFALFASCSDNVVEAQGARQAYPPTTGQSKPAASQKVRNRAQPKHGASAQQKSFVEQASYCDPCACGGDICCGDCFGCGNSVCGDPYWPSPRKPVFYAGFEATFLKPRFEENVAFTVMESDGASFESFADTEFDYDLELAPRVFLGWKHCDNVGLRATWWQFDHEAATASASPPANGFGSITHPAFGNVDISSVVPTDVFSAASELNAYTIDLEATKETSFRSWDFGVGGGVRYAYAEQRYFAQLRGANQALRGEIDFRHSIKGVGPTISFDAYRPFGCRSGIFCKARGSVLFGDGESNLAAIEDADLTTPFNTTHIRSRDDLLSIGEIQFGYRWKARKTRRKTFVPFLSVAMEGQIWDGAGNAASEEGTLGFFGFNSGVGIDW